MSRKSHKISSWIFESLSWSHLWSWLWFSCSSHWSFSLHWLPL